MPDTCIRCRGFFLYGEPLYSSFYNDDTIWWCRDCIEEYSSAIWPEDRGPYPATIYPRARPLRCDA